jgi:hypothetical protein
MLTQLGLSQMSVSCMCIHFALTTGPSRSRDGPVVVPVDREPCRLVSGHVERLGMSYLCRPTSAQHLLLGDIWKDQ